MRVENTMPPPTQPPSTDRRTPADPVDRFTLERAIRGDRRARGMIVSAHQRAVFSAVSRILVGRPDLWEDVTQDAFVKVLRNLGRFDPDGSARLSTWVLTIAARTAIDLGRQQRRRAPDASLNEATATAADASPEYLVMERDLGRRVEARVAELPVEQRAVLVLRAYHDLDYDEIAAATDSTRSSVKSRLNRARVALRRAFRGTDHDRESSP